MDTHQVGHGEEFDLFTAEITDLKPCNADLVVFFMDEIQGIPTKKKKLGWLKTTVLFMG